MNEESYPLRVLLVEDNPADATLIQLRAEEDSERPLTVHHVDTLASALLVMKNRDFDAILLDLNLPDSFGYDTFANIMGAAPNTPILPITGQDDTALTRRCLEEGAQDYLIKGNVEGFISKAVHNAVTRAKLTRELRNTEKDLVRSNRSLRAGRDLNRLISQEKDIQSLLQGACDLLTHSLGYRAVRTVLWNEDHIIEHYASSGDVGSRSCCDHKLASISPSSDAPPCLERARDKTPTVAVIPQAICKQCCTGPGHHSAQSISGILRFDDRELGILSALVADDSLVDDPEVGLVSDIAADLSVAIHSLRLERMIQRSQEEISALYAHTPLIILLVNEVGKIRHVNQAGLESLDLSSEDQIVGLRGGNALRCIYAVTQGHSCGEGLQCESCELRQTMVDTITTGAPHYQVECPITTMDENGGSEMRFLVSTVRITIQKKNQTLVCLQDVTQERLMQASLAQSDRLAAMGMLAAGVAHEINNPLIYIMYNLDSLIEELPEIALGMDRCYHEFVRYAGEAEVLRLLGAWAEVYNPMVFSDIVDRAKQALKGTERIQAIAKGLGTFTRAERADEREINLNSPLESALNMAYNEIKYRARLVKDLGKLPNVTASEGRLAQVFLNLLINATHAMEPGDMEANAVRVRTFADEEWVYAEISDTGSGIAPENIDRLFLPFFTTKARGEGTGLGLYISNNIVAELGGEISVTSNLGVGTKFTVKLPYVSSPVVATPSPEVSRNDGRKHGRVLIVDDEKLVRDTLYRMLRRTHEVVTAASGTEGRQMLKEDRRFDAVICDLIMPEVSGMDLYQWLTGEDAELAKHMIFISAGAFTEKSKTFLHTVENVCLEKPFHASHILSAVDQAIHRGPETGPMRMGE